MKSHARVAIIGGGVVGASVLYHLTKLGWADVLLIERSELTAGSTWHAAAGFHSINPDPNLAALQTYTINLYKQIEAESGQSVGLHMPGGINIAGTAERWDWLKNAWAVFQTMGATQARLISPEEIKELCPIVDIGGVFGGLYDPNEGHVDPYGTTQAFARAAAKRGAEITLHNRVVALRPQPDGRWLVVTEHGSCLADHVVNAAGLWAKQVGLMAGVDLPVVPMEHHYLATESIPEIAALKLELPITVDLEGFTYLRQEAKGVLLGVYERNPKHWNVEGAPWDYGTELLPEDIDRISPELSKGFQRFPCVQRAGIKRWVNGPLTFTPDGNPLVGPVPSLRNYWVACGVMAGFSQCGGVGQSLASWIANGEPTVDIFGMDIARYGDFAANRNYLKSTTRQFYSRRFVLTYPNEELPAGRPLRRSGAYDQMTGAGARWGVTWGLEVPLYFAPENFTETPTLRRSEAHHIVARECHNARAAVGLLDTTGFSRFQIRGEGAKTWLDRLVAAELPAAGKVRLAPLLSPSGRLLGDMTVFNWGDNTWWLMGSYSLRQWHMRWFESQPNSENVRVTDISDLTGGVSIFGPRSRDVLSRLSPSDVTNSRFPFMACQSMDVADLQARVARLTITGELGYEINVLSTEHATLWSAIMEVGKEFGIAPIGYNAALSLRLEKSFGIWLREYASSYTPQMNGLSRFVKTEKGDFVGREAYLRNHDEPARQRLVTLAVDALDADATGYEPVWDGRNRVGFITSGGYGHTVARSLALAYVDESYARTGSELEVHIVGARLPCRIIPDSPYDPSGSKMRS
jgi:dimethylglycine dehydrogenase